MYGDSAIVTGIYRAKGIYQGGPYEYIGRFTDTDGGVQFDRRDLDAHDLLALQLLKDAIQNAVLGPAIHAGVNGVPVAETLGESSPFAALLGDIEDRVQHREVGQAHVAALPGKTGLDAVV